MGGKRTVRGILLLVTILCISVLFVVPLAKTAGAQPTHEEVRAAIADGVAWLVAQQNNDDGSWGTWEVVAVTALAVKKLEHHAVDCKWGLCLDSPFNDANPYKENIEKGLAFLFDNGSSMAIVPQPAGDPDSDGDGIGVYFGAEAHRRTYNTSIALMTICEAVELDRVVESGPLAGWSYEQVARDTMDYLAFGQNDAGNERGGWGYHENDVDWSDQSNTGYVALGLGFAEAAPPEGCGFTIPQFVRVELDVWIGTIQDPVDGDADDGGSWYNPDFFFFPWVNILKTGNLLQQMALVGDTVDTPRVQDALDYLARHWNDANQDPGWRGSGVADYQATFTTMKGLTALGLFHEFGDPPIEWQSDFETVLLAEQLPDGSWPFTRLDFGDYYGDPPILSTLWALLTLQKVAPPPVAIPVPFDIKPQSCRNPLNVAAQGVLPAAILGTEDFDVTHVDVETVQLEGVSSLRSALEDVATPFEPFTGKEDAFDCTDEGPDGLLDLTLKFDVQGVVAALGEVSDGEVWVLRLTGNLKEEFGGTPIKGEDVVVILKKGKK